MVYDLLYQAYMDIYDLESCFRVRLEVMTALNSGVLDLADARLLFRLIAARMLTHLKAMQEPTDKSTFRLIGYSSVTGEPVFVMETKPGR